MRLFFSRFRKENAKVPGRVSIVFDDCAKNIYKIAYPIMKARNLSGTVSLITGSLSGHYLWEYPEGNIEIKELLEMTADGWEFVSHQHSHDKNTNAYTLTNGKLDEARIRWEFSESKRILRALGCNDQVYVWVGGGYNRKVLRIAKEYFTAARCSDKGKNSLHPTRAKERILLKACWGWGDCAFADMKHAIDLAIRKNAWVILSYHGIEATDPVLWKFNVSVDQFTKTMDYLKSTGVPVMNFEQALGLKIDKTASFDVFAEDHFEHWFIRENGKFQCPVNWSRIPIVEHQGSLPPPLLTDCRQEENIKLTGRYSCKITAEKAGHGIERVVGKRLVGIITLHVFPVSGGFKLRFVGYDRNEICSGESTQELKTWQKLEIKIDATMPDNAYLQVIATENNSEIYVDDINYEVAGTARDRN